MQNSIIKSKIQSLWDRLWSGGLSNPITAIEQISFLLFMKRLEKFKPNIPEEYEWSFYSEIKGENLVKHVKETVFEYIKTDLAKEGEPFAKAMRDATFRINKPSLLEDAIQHIDEIYQEIETEEANNQHFQDIQGDVYEHLLKHTSEAGKNGQFRTPRHIIQMMAEILDPDTNGKICDLASGSAGFLVGAYQYIIKKYSKKVEKDENGLEKGVDGKNLSPAQKKKLKESLFYGYDIDQTMVRIGMMNLMMHGIDKPQITHLDTLSNEFEKHEGGKLKGKGKYKYILANPPFTGKINSVTVSTSLQRIYQLFDEDGKIKKDKDGNPKKQTIQSELVFLERIVYMLKKGGRAAVIVPEGVLFNSGGAYRDIRKILMYDCILQGVISLPEGVFQPYTNVKTSILIFEKKKSNTTKLQSEDVWFYELQSDGYSLDTQRRLMKENPLPIIIEKWRNRNNKGQYNRKSQFFNIPSNEIESNAYELNINLYKEFVYEAQNFRKPERILEQLEQLESEILRGLEDLKEYSL